MLLAEALFSYDGEYPYYQDAGAKGEGQFNLDSAVGRLADMALQSWGVEDVPSRRKSTAKLNLSLRGRDLSMKEFLAQRGLCVNSTTVEMNFIPCVLYHTFIPCILYHAFVPCI